MSFGKMSSIKYVSFCGISSQARLGCLHANNCNNVKGRYEILFNQDLNYLVDIENRMTIIKNYLINVKIRGNKLFIRVE